MNRSLTLALAPLWLAATAHAANTAPTVVIQSAAMRGATGLMDVVFRVNDPDDATVKTRALAFIDGQRSFANLVKPTTFAEGTAAKIGDTIATNTNHTLTWNVAADWNIDLGQIKFEILAMDNRGLLPLDWVTIPAANGQPELTISKNAPTDQDVLDALFWQYASGDPGLTLENGVLRGNENSGVFEGVPLAGEGVIDPNTWTSTPTYKYATPFIAKRMNLGLADERQINYANRSRKSAMSPDQWHLLNENYSGTSILISSDHNYTGHKLSVRAVNAVKMTGGSDYILINPDGTIVGFIDWINNVSDGVHDSQLGQIIAIKSDGSLNVRSGIFQPPDLTRVKSVAISSGSSFLAVEIGGNLISRGNISWSWSPGPQFIPTIQDAKKVICSRISGQNFVQTEGGSLIEFNLVSNDQQARLSEQVYGDCFDFDASHWWALVINTEKNIFYTTPPYGTIIPDNISNVRCVATNYTHSIAVKFDGEIIAWRHPFPGTPFHDPVNLPGGFTHPDGVSIENYGNGTINNTIFFRKRSL